jgi:flagellar protein FlaC
MVDIGKSIEDFAKQLPFGLGNMLKKGEKPPSQHPETLHHDEQHAAAGQGAPPQDSGQIEIGIVQESSFDSAQAEDLKKQIALSTERLAEMESRVVKAEKMAESVKKENEQLKGRMDQTDSRILDMLSVYEVVSNQINPFVGSSKVISSTMEQMQEELNSLKTHVSTMGSDLKILARGRVDIGKLIKTSVTDEDQKRRIDLTKLIRSAVQGKKIAKKEE